MDNKVFYLRHNDARRGCADYALNYAPDGWRVEFEPPKRKVEQNDKFHAQIDYIAKAVPFMGKMENSETWKRLLVDAFVRVMREQARAQDRPDPFPGQARVVPSLDGGGVVQLGVQTRAFSVALAGEFISYLESFAAENNVQSG